jgi:hypothetical protein
MAAVARCVLRFTATLIVASMLVACGRDSASPGGELRARADLGVDVAQLSPVVDNPYVAFASVRRAVYEGEEDDAETDERIGIRVESTVRDTPVTVAGVEVTVVEVTELEDGELVEKTEDYYAQDPRSGIVYYMGERVDDYEDGRISGHGGQWLAGENGNQAGVFMPAAPQVGDVFEQERAPGIAEDRSTVIATGVTVTVPAGTFNSCIETEDFDPIGMRTERKIYCRGMGLVREVFEAGGSLALVHFETR